MSTNKRAEGDYSLTEPESGPAGKGDRAHQKRDVETVGESAGGLLGASAGIAGAVGGWWAGRNIADAINVKDDDAFRRHFNQVGNQLADLRYEDVRPAYLAGHLAGRNPDYAGRSFEEVESDLRCGWGTEIVRHCGEWPVIRRYARTAFDRARGGRPSEIDAD